MFFHILKCLFMYLVNYIENLLNNINQIKIFNVTIDYVPICFNNYVFFKIHSLCHQCSNKRGKKSQTKAKSNHEIQPVNILIS